eukprot:364439-Chlamydomonas_euryale.AAC.10
MPIAIAVLPVPGCPASSTARPAIFPSLIICKMTPAACGGSRGRADRGGGQDPGGPCRAAFPLKNTLQMR